MIKDKDYTIQITPEKGIVLGYLEKEERRNLAYSLDDFTKIEVIDTANTPIIAKYPDQELER